MIKELLIILLASSLINNVVLSQFLGLTPFMATSKKVESAASMGAAVILIITIASAVNAAIYEYVLIPTGTDFLQTVVFILIIIFIVQFLGMVMNRFMRNTYRSLGVNLPLIITNSVILGAVFINVRKDYDILSSTINGFSLAVGFAFVIVIFASIREKIVYNEIPESFKGLPILLVIAGLMSMAFLGFSTLLL